MPACDEQTPCDRGEISSMAAIETTAKVVIPSVPSKASHRDEVDDPQDLRLWLKVDGRRYQDGSTPWARSVSYLSLFMSLQPGDVISTGTPPGVGLDQKPPVI